MDPAVNIGIRLPVVIIHCGDHNFRLLGRGSRIKVNQFNPRADFSLEDGEVLTNLIYIEGHVSPEGVN
jgi:hypothetical protein